MDRVQKPAFTDCNAPSSNRSDFKYERAGRATWHSAYFSDAAGFLPASCLSPANEIVGNESTLSNNQDHTCGGGNGNRLKTFKFTWSDLFDELTVQLGRCYLLLLLGGVCGAEDVIKQHPTSQSASSEWSVRVTQWCERSPQHHEADNTISYGECKLVFSSHHLENKWHEENVHNMKYISSAATTLVRHNFRYCTIRTKIQFGE
jgi:hypothetical protein